MRELALARLRPIIRPALSVLLAGLLASTQAGAQGFPAKDVGGWTVAASKDGEGCFLTKTFAGAGGTTLLLGLDRDGSNHLSLLNANWSIKAKERWKLTFKLSAGGYAKHQVVGMASDGKKGFVTSFDAKFPAHFATSKAIHIYRGDVPVEQLNLEGSGAAVAELRRCIGVIGTAVAETGRSDRIPKDPFAPESRLKSRD
jgi:hypothetical protein